MAKTGSRKSVQQTQRKLTGSSKKSTKRTARTRKVAKKKLAANGFVIDPSFLWEALAKTPGVGVSITDAEGRLLYVNDTTMALFSDATDIDYEGKRISDFHPPEFVRERLQMLAHVLREGRPLSLRHIYKGRCIQSTMWPVCDHVPPYDRVIVVSFTPNTGNAAINLPDATEVGSTRYIDLGPLDVLTQRELEVLVLLGHGMSVPKSASLLHRSPKTIQRHKSSISRKLGVHGQAELVSVVASLGLELSHAKLRRFSKSPQ